MNGMKTYLIGGAMILIALVKLFTEIPEVETISMLGATEPSDLISAGLLVVTGRSALKKLEVK